MKCNNLLKIILILICSNITFQFESTQDPEIAERQCIRRKPTNCVDVLQQGYKKSGVYTIYPWYGKHKISVYCDMETDGGGWIVFQRREDYEPRVNFFQGWDAYQDGFGQLDKEFWLGNHNLYTLTNQEYVTLRVDLEDFEGGRRYAIYKEFNIGNCQDRFRLTVKNYYGDAGDGLSSHNNYTFVTYDDGDVKGCARTCKGAWWYHGCYSSTLNGLYLKGNTSLTHQGVIWTAFKGHNYSLKKSEMKFRPSQFL